MHDAITDTAKKNLYIALGSNVGDRESWLAKALAALNRLPGVRQMVCSAVYDTDPVGYTEQASFLNMAVKLEVEMPVVMVFRCMREIETSLGRRREIHWGPRTIDLDLLMVDNLDVQIRAYDPELIVPHPRMLERAFVLIPLLDVLERQHPDYEKLEQCLQLLSDREGVRLWREAVP
ncbi:2-amino-4-hydroxy-6-hydroxymethyldihydropteridine pyrophosphokinase [Insulibacter thermoxylanivorax]|uniref:2-amino-4-hydroxy-6-hydroxymethyldihydropteridine diphosphokinase n=1 Tax=Insulibacter thermoxylanivorax TaxID=2749268 RepID=A0A916QGF4_9BACL|nr:2-amino-4-hydroxy-6-hydroxymethyldihydropteridine diphosphokinase [Insulibacter thermoxylanivorax]GFR38439.1 2-amino-4-hydroxy-6-hydroxymethyldihydropteridine pyrophosphokinase [Insulibacter thermoxylanivorax]